MNITTSIDVEWKYLGLGEQIMWLCDLLLVHMQVHFSCEKIYWQRGGVFPQFVCGNKVRFI